MKRARTDVPELVIVSDGEELPADADENAPAASSSSAVAATPGVLMTMERRKRGAIHLASPPEGVFHLGEDKFVTVRLFYGTIRIHIRKYFLAPDEFYYPTKHGVSLSTKVWKALGQYLKLITEEFDEGEEDPVFDDAIILKDLMIANERHGEVTFQRLFRRSGVYEFVPENVRLTTPQWNRLHNAQKDILECVKLWSIHRLLPYLVELEVKRKFPLSREKEEDVPMSPEVCRLIKNKVVESMKCSFFGIITDLMSKNCDGCKNNFQNQLGHSCIYWKENVSTHFDECFTSACWKSIAQNLVSDLDLRKVNIKEFFGSLNVEDLLDRIREACNMRYEW